MGLIKDVLIDQKFFEAVEEERKKTSLTDVHHRSWTMLVLGKRCQITANSYLPTFRERYRDGIPYLFQLAVPGDDGQPHEIDGLSNFTLFNLKIKTRAQLDRKDVEYDLLRIMG